MCSFVFGLFPALVLVFVIRITSCASSLAFFFVLTWIQAQELCSIYLNQNFLFHDERFVARTVYE
jgi:hypothetical protein